MGSLAPELTAIGQMDCGVGEGVLAARRTDCGTVTSVDDLDEDDEGLLACESLVSRSTTDHTSLGNFTGVISPFGLEDCLIVYDPDQDA
jgi:hypothetical protein